jgi:hypothetical protein
MAKRRKAKAKTDRQILRQLFPPEIVREVDAAIRENDDPLPRFRNPSASKPPKKNAKSMPKE